MTIGRGGIGGHPGAEGDGRSAGSRRNLISNPPLTQRVPRDRGEEDFAGSAIMRVQSLRRLLLAGSGLALVGAVPAMAQQAEECGPQLDQIEQRLTQAELSEDRQNDVQQIVQGARTLADTGDAEGCLRVVAELEDLMQTLEESGQAQAGSEQPQTGTQQDQQAAGEQQPAQQDQEQAQAGEQDAEATAEVTAELAIQQPQPEITIRQQAPRITVQIPKPIITVQMPEPQVTVDMPEPEVTVRMGEPEIRVEGAEAQASAQGEQQAQPKVTIEQAEPEVTVEQAEPEVRFAEGGQDQQGGQGQQMAESQGGPPASEAPEEMAEAEPQEEMAEAESQEEIAEGEQPATEQQPAMAETEAEQQEEAGAEQQMAATGESPLAAMPASDVIGADVVNADGETVADIVDLVKKTGEDQLYAVLSVGGFLGIGDKKVVVDIAELDVTPDGQILMANASEEQLKDMPAYDEEGFETAQQQ
jgi:hypothetical protein